MALSKFLQGERAEIKELVGALLPHYKYVSALATDCRSKIYRVDRATASVTEGTDFVGECGFVIKVHNGKAFGEYSASSIAGDKNALAEKIVKAIDLDSVGGTIECSLPIDKEKKADFCRESDFEDFEDKDILAFCNGLKEEIIKKDDKILNVFVLIRPIVINKLFISKNRELSQHYGWVNGDIMIVYRDEKIVQARESAYGVNMKEVFDTLPKLVDKLIEKAKHLAKAKPIKPGVYDIITDSSITGLIAHEAFGHGVEMDQFVKNRALAKDYM